MGPGATGTYRSVEPQESLKLATTRFLISQLTTARVLCFSRPPTPSVTLRPHCHLGIYRWQRSLGARAATPPPVEIRMKGDRVKELLRWLFGVTISLFSVLSHHSYRVYNHSVFVWLGKIGIWYRAHRSISLIFNKKKETRPASIRPYEYSV